MQVVGFWLFLVGFCMSFLVGVGGMFVGNLSRFLPELWWIGVVESFFVAIAGLKTVWWKRWVRIAAGSGLAFVGVVLGMWQGFLARHDVGISVVFVFLVGGMAVVTGSFLFRKMRFFVYLLEGYPPDSSLSYEQWAGGEIARLNGTLSMEGEERFFFYVFLIGVIVSGIGALVNPGVRGHLSLALVVFVGGFWMSWVVFHEKSQLLGWRMQGISLEKEKRGIPFWMVLVVLGFCFGVGTLLPNRFVVISLEAIGERFRESVKQTEIGLQNAPQEETNQSIETTPSEEGGGERKASSSSFGWVLVVILVVGGVYLLLGGIGYVVGRFWSYRPKNRVLRFFLWFYEKNKGVFEALGFLLGLFVSVLLTITGIEFIRRRFLERREEKTGNEELRKQLYALFESGSEVSDEKKEEIMTIVRYFVNLIEAASVRVLPYRPSYGPLEYIEKLVVNLPSLRESLLWIVSVFNESRYSQHLLSVEKRDAFAQTVETVISEISK